MSAAEVEVAGAAPSRPAGRSAGRLQTVIVIAVTVVVIGVAAVLIGGTGSSDDGVAKVNLGGGVTASALQVGDTPPPFTTVTYDDKPVNLADYAGKPLWLTFGASWCPDCRHEAADLEAAYEANRDKGLNVLAVFVRDPKDSVAGYAKRAGLTFPIGMDENDTISAAYRTMGYPTHLFIGADGTIKIVRIGALSREEMDRAIAAILN